MTDPPTSTTETTCAIVGGGPGGMMLAYLLARKGIDVTLLEAGADFDRDFRGDTLHPASLELLDTLGLAGHLLALPHRKARHADFVDPATGARTVLADFGRLPTRFPYVTLMPQSDFLDFLAAEAAAFPGFRLVMGAKARGLLEAEGRVVGVTYRVGKETHALRAPLVVGADGRSSRMRSEGGFDLRSFAVPMDVLWFRLPRRPEDPGTEAVTARVGGGGALIALDRADHWQIGYVFPKDGYRAVRARGLAALHTDLAARLPELADRVETLDDWKKIALLTVQAGRVTRWHRPGLLLIGDAAHVMSPMGGVGINYALQDAVAAADVLVGPLRTGHVTEAHLAEVERRRLRATAFIQRMQTLAQARILGPALKDGAAFQMPGALRVLPRLPGLRRLLPRLLAFGLYTEHLDAWQAA